jgi:hypothetical protein
MSPPLQREFAGAIVACYGLLKNIVLCMNIGRFTQPTKNSKNLTLFVSSECELKPLFPKLHCFWRSFEAATTRPCISNAQTTYSHDLWFLQCEY